MKKKIPNGVVIEGDVVGVGEPVFSYEYSPAEAGEDPTHLGEHVYVTTHGAAVSLAGYMGKRVRVTIEVLGDAGLPTPTAQAIGIILEL